MSDVQALTAFAQAFHEDLVVRAETEGSQDYLENEFTRSVIEYLVDAGEIDHGEVAFYAPRGVKANGYGINSEEDSLYLFVSEFTRQLPPRAVPKSDLEAAFRRVRVFLTKALRNELHHLEESSPAFEAIDQIAAWRSGLARVRLYLLTDGLVSAAPPPDATVEGLPITHHIWDIERLHRFASSGHQREPIEIDFAAMPEGPLPCLVMPGAAGEYSAYLAIIPGSVLFRIYEQFGTRLLERNVRAFLQARGKVNKGIRETILKFPDRFLAYNNGISVTAAEVRVVTLPDGTSGLAWTRDFQIVNGGQTTASIHQAVRKDKADVSAVFVQAKLSVVEPAKLDALVPVISKNANSQNKVSDADFWANDPFHVRLEEISRTVWASPVDGKRQTRWFYERARGQYADAKIRQSTPARKRVFVADHPPRQRFTKTDVAKFENSWAQLPHFVSRGAEKNFREFAIRLSDRNAPLPTEEYFHRLVAKAILFRECESLVSAMQFGGYRSQIVTYTIAYLSHATAMGLDFDSIWRMQTLPTPVVEAIQAIAPAVHASITSPPGGKNIAEWCKAEACWVAVRDVSVAIPDVLVPQRGEAGYGPVPTTSNSEGSSTPEQEFVAAIAADTWFTLSGWARETDNLRPWERGLAYSLGTLAGRGRAPSIKQARHGARILAEAIELGFRKPEEGTS